MPYLEMLMHRQIWVAFLVILHFLLTIYFSVRILLRPNREPMSRIAWLLLLFALPYVGMLFYILFGNTNIGKSRYLAERQSHQQILAWLTGSTFQPIYTHEPLTNLPVDYAIDYKEVFQLGYQVNQFLPTYNNAVTLMANSTDTIKHLVQDIDNAQHHVHLLFYIWLTDHSGIAVIQALLRARQRGVSCRVIVDGHGSRDLIASTYWQTMQHAGVKTAIALKIKNPLLQMFFGRLDLRNHRKIMVIDSQVTYCGSQNCADASFAPKASYAPWVDCMIRLTGEVVLQNQLVFLATWQAITQEIALTSLPITDFLNRPAANHGKVIAQVIATGPTESSPEMPQVFVRAIMSAKNELIITTPYFIPNEAILTTLCVVAMSGVAVKLIVPKRNDSWIVGYASRSHYAILLQSGVRIFEYRPGLLHAKTITVDNVLTLIGSANMDRRSFELNYENNMLLLDADITQSIITRQQQYLADSDEVNLSDVKAWPIAKVLSQNLLAVISPIL